MFVVLNFYAFEGSIYSKFICFWLGCVYYEKRTILKIKLYMLFSIVKVKDPIINKKKKNN